MLTNLVKMIHGLATVDQGGESVLNEDAFEGFIGLIRDIYGNYVSDVVRKGFVFRDDALVYVCVKENLEDYFIAALHGKDFSVVREPS